MSSELIELAQKKRYIGKMIKVELKRKCMSQKEFGVLVNRSSTCISEWIKGIKSPTAPMLLHIKEILDLDL